MRTLEEIRESLKLYKLAEVSRQTGVSAPRLYRFMDGAEPLYGLVYEIEKWLDSQKSKP
jgi:hypothetical protein